MEAVSTTLKQGLAARGISQRQLAKITGMAHCDINLLCNGKRSLFPKWKTAIAKALGASEAEVVEMCIQSQREAVDKHIGEVFSFEGGK